jgi:hypothetical protein
MSAFLQPEEWASEFADSTAFSFLPDAVKEQAPGVCAEFARRAGEATEADVRRVMLEEMPALELSPAARAALPETLAAFAAWLEDTGRLGGGRSLARWIGALGPAYQERCSPKGGLRIPPVVKKTSDIGRNDPCPCGSGRKYKKCCST